MVHLHFCVFLIQHCPAMQPVLFIVPTSLQINTLQSVHGGGSIEVEFSMNLRSRNMDLSETGQITCCFVSMHDLPVISGLILLLQSQL